MNKINDILKHFLGKKHQKTKVESNNLSEPFREPIPLRDTFQDYTDRVAYIADIMYRFIRADNYNPEGIGDALHGRYKYYYRNDDYHNCLRRKKTHDESLYDRKMLAYKNWTNEIKPRNIDVYTYLFSKLSTQELVDLKDFYDEIYDLDSDSLLAHIRGVLIQELCVRNYPFENLFNLNIPGDLENF